jgi:L-carnitine CoA-transferase
MAFIKQNVDNSKHYPPKAGPLQDVKVVFSAVQVAGPFGPHLMAEWGADVIWLESTKNGGDPLRAYRQAEADHRNDRSMALDIFSTEGMEVFKKLIAGADVFLTSGKGPSFIRRGITDEFLWSINPQLVITRISGYGQEDAHPDYLNRACFDGIAQAMSGYMSQNGMPDGPPIPGYPYVGDLFTAVYSCAATLAALTRARETGVGESVDVAMTEVLLRLITYNIVDYLNDGIIYDKPGDKDPVQMAVGVYKTKDGFLLMNVLGVPQLKQFFSDIGVEHLYGTEEYPNTMAYIPMLSSKAPLIAEKIDKYMLAKTSAEHQAYFDSIAVACSPVLGFPDLPNHPQYDARKMFVEWETMYGEEYKAVNIVPRFKVNPTKIWRAMPTQGYDNDAILSDLGYSDEEIAELYNKGVIAKAQSS